MRRTILFVQSLLASTAIASAHAAEADSTRTVTLDDVTIVSAPKELDAMRQQPSSVSMLSGGQLNAAQVTSLKGITSLVPNLFIPDYGSRLTSAVYLRGIGSRINTPAVGMYVDNIPYIDKAAFDFNFYDVERIDVLRGPQGTLYGRNAMGGIIHVHTRNPIHYQGTDLHLGYASGNSHRTLSLSHYHRLTDALSFSAAGYYEGADGFFSNSFTHQKVDELQSGGGRLRAIYKPSDRLSFDLALSYDYTDEGAYPYFYTGSLAVAEDYPELIGQISNNRRSSYRRSLINAGLNAEYQATHFTLDVITGFQHLRDRMFMDQDFLHSDIYTLQQRQRINTFTQEWVFKGHSTGLWQWVSGLNLMYQQLHTQAPVTFFGEGLEWLQGTINGAMPEVADIKMLAMMGFGQMSMHFGGDQMLLSNDYQSPTLGAALFHQSNLRLTDHFTATLGLRLDFEHLSLDYDSPAQVNYGFDMPNQANDKMSVHLSDLTSNLLYHGAMQHSYLKLLPKLALKYEWDSQNNLYLSAAMGQRSGGYNLQMFADLMQGAMRVDMMDGIKEGVGNYLDHLAETVPTMPKVIPDPDHPGQMVELPTFVRRIMEQNMPQFQQPDIDQIVYKPEYSWCYELGTHLSLLRRHSSHSSSRSFDSSSFRHIDSSSSRHIDSSSSRNLEPSSPSNSHPSALTLDASLFLMQTRQQQIARFAGSGLGRMMVNAGRSRSYGAEVAATYLPLDALRLMLSYGYTHATFTDYADGSTTLNAAGETVPVDYSGRYVPFVPQHTLSLDASYTLPLPLQWAHSMTIGATYQGAGRIYWTESNLTADGLREACQSYYSTLGVRLQFTLPHATIQLWARNLTDTHYNTFYFESASRGFEQHAKPRQFGIDLRFHLFK